MFEQQPFTQVSESVTKQDDTIYTLVNCDRPGDCQLLVRGDTSDFEGETLADGSLLGPRSPHNATVLRQRLPWLQPAALGLQTSAGFGDRLGIATPGHVLATRGTGVAPIYAQQSVRENTRTGRTPQQVVDDAMWGAFHAGWKEPWGADADHLKTLEDIPPFVVAGYTFYTIDPGEYVDDAADTDNAETLRRKVEQLPWSDLQATLEETSQRYQRAFTLDDRTLTFTQEDLYKALGKYGGAVAHTARMARRLQELQGQHPFEMEMSVDETGTTTALLEHFYIASELKRLGVPFVSLAPRFVGRFEKGVGYIGDLDELTQNINGHASIMRYFDNSYKLSLHTGSDKFEVYPIAMQATGGLVHLKTAGTSYLEALRLIASIDRPLFREIWDFTRAHYENDRRTYHVSAVLSETLPAKQLTDEQLPELLNQFGPRQILHVTFGSVLDTYGTELQRILRTHLPEYWAYIQRHFDKHLAPFKQ